MLIFNIIFPIFAIAGLGYAFALMGLFTPEHGKGLSRYVLNFAIPILLFQSLSKITLPETINWAFFVSYYLVVLVIYAAGFLIGRQRFGYGRKGGALFGMGSSYSNLVLIGIPVITAALGEAALLPHLLIISFHSAVQFTLTTVLAESETTRNTAPLDFIRLPLQKIIKNPIIIGLISGLLFNWFSIQIPAVVESTITLIRGSALPAALFMLGASLAAYKISGQLNQASIIVGLKVLIQPLLVYLLVVVVFDLPQPWSAVAVIAAGLPAGVNSAVFANKYDAVVAPIGTAVLLSTLISIGTISFLLTLFI
ncbi:MAG: AEC family transporter [Anaerolineae bacterium]